MDNYDSVMKGLGIAAGAGEVVSGTVMRALQANQLDDSIENKYKQKIKDVRNSFIGNSDFDSLQNEFGSFRFADTDLDKWDIMGGTLGQQWGQWAANAAQGAAAGASLGTQIAPGMGTAIGAAIGFVADGISTGFSLLDKRIKSKRIANSLNNQGLTANKQAMDNLDNTTYNIMSNKRNAALLNTMAEGGKLYTDDTFSNGVRLIEEGQSHEKNPYGGVLQGFAMDGLPNLVEEGEVIYDDYVYSNRLFVPEEDKELLGLNANKDYTYADAAGVIQKESEERPNDPISKRNLKVMMSRLQGSQEELKQKKDAKKLAAAFKKLSPEEQTLVAEGIGQLGQFAKGGMLGHYHVPAWMESSYLLTEPGRYSGWPFVSENGDVNKDLILGDVAATRNIYDPSIGSFTKTPSKLETPDIFDGYTRDNTLGNSKNPSTYASPYAQLLRSAPVWGSIAGAIGSFFDKPSYGNIEAAENRMYRVPNVSARPIGEKMIYRPLDINYLMNRLNNRSLGNRRAAQEYNSGNRTAAVQLMAANDFDSQIAAGEALINAMQYNDAQRKAVQEFNRGTSMFNSEQALKADQLNQALGLNKANFLLQTGQLRDAELARIQNNRSIQLTNMFNQMGNLGKDMLARQQVAANADSGTYGVLNEIFKELLANYGAKTNACGGKLNTKKGGKHA